MVRVGCHAETIKRKVVAGIQKSGKTPEESFDSFDIDVDGLINHLELQKGLNFSFSPVQIGLLIEKWDEDNDGGINQSPK